MKKKIRNTCCIPNCGVTAAVNEMCFKHNGQVRDGKEDFTRYRVMREIDEDNRPIPVERYRAQVKGITRGLDIPRQLRGDFNRRMMAGYYSAYGKHGGRWIEL